MMFAFFPLLAAFVQISEVYRVENRKNRWQLRAILTNADNELRYFLQGICDTNANYACNQPRN